MSYLSSVLIPFSPNSFKKPQHTTLEFDVSPHASVTCDDSITSNTRCTFESARVAPFQHKDRCKCVVKKPIVTGGVNLSECQSVGRHSPYCIKRKMIRRTNSRMIQVGGEGGGGGGRKGAEERGRPYVRTQFQTRAAHSS